MGKTILNVYSVGTEVSTVVGKITAVITAILLRDKSIQYEIAYFNHGDYKSAWVYEFEIIVINKINDTTKIGFK